MTTWDDIFDAGGDKRRYLLRTVSAEPDALVYKDLADGNVFWDTNRTIIIEGTTYYYCYRFQAGLTAKKNYYEEYLRQDIQGLA